MIWRGVPAGEYTEWFQLESIQSGSSWSGFGVPAGEWLQLERYSNRLQIQTKVFKMILYINFSEQAMTTCTNCGVPVTPEMRACGSCGTPVKGPDFVGFCPNCGTRLESKNAPCKNCGHGDNPPPRTDMFDAPPDPRPDKFDAPPNSYNSGASSIYKNEGNTLLLAAILGIFGISGIGHIYLGQVGRGVIILIAGIILVALIIITFGVAIVGYAILFVWQIFDARKLCRTYNTHLQSYGRPPW